MDGTSRRTRNNGGAITKPLANADDFWKFCLQHYNKPEVQKACMALQENYKGNVNIALILAWLEFGGFSLSNSSVLALEHSLKKTEPLLRRYRLLRRDIKDQLSKGAYQKVLNFELALEKTQQQDLIECLNAQTWHPDTNKALEDYFKNLHPDAIALYPDIISRLTPASKPKSEQAVQASKAKASKTKTTESLVPSYSFEKGIPLAMSNLPSELLASTSLEEIKQLKNPLEKTDMSSQDGTDIKKDACAKNKPKLQKDTQAQKNNTSQVETPKNVPFVPLTNEDSLESTN